MKARVCRWIQNKTLHQMLYCFLGVLQSNVTTSIPRLEKSTFSPRSDAPSRWYVTDLRMIGGILNSYEKLKPARRTGRHRNICVTFVPARSSA